MKKAFYILLLILFSCGYSIASCPLPYFASLRVPKVNIRSGPGYHYPVQWQLLRSQLPVEVLSKFEHWLKIQDIDGTIGWVHTNMISAKKRTVIFDSRATLYKSPNSESQIIAYIEPRVIAEVSDQKSGWCYISIGDFKGWVSTKHVWGISDTKENALAIQGPSRFGKALQKLKQLFSG